MTTVSYSSELSGQHCASDTTFYEPNNIPFYSQLYPQQSTECTQFFGTFSSKLEFGNFLSSECD